MTQTLCLKCGNEMEVPEAYLGRSVRCNTCSENFTAMSASAALESRHAAEELRRVDEVELLRITGLKEVLEYLAATKGEHYMALEAGSREAIEGTVDLLLSAEFAQISELESQILRLVYEIDGRSEFLAQRHQVRVEALMSQSVQIMKSLSDSINRTLGTIAQRLDSVKSAVVMTGVVAAQSLGQSISKQLSGEDLE